MTNQEILAKVAYQKTNEYHQTIRELVAATNARAIQKSVRLNLDDVVLFVDTSHQLQTRMEEGFIAIYLVQGNGAYEIEPQTLGHVDQTK